MSERPTVPAEAEEAQQLRATYFDLLFGAVQTKLPRPVGVVEVRLI